MIDPSDEEAADGAPEGGPAPETNADPAVVRKKARTLKAKAELQQRLLLQFLSSRDARDWVYEFLAGCHVYATSYVAGDSHATAFAEGERNVGLKLIAQLPPKLYALMIEEHSDVQR